MKTKLFPIAIALFFVSASLRAHVPAGNFWHNPTFEAGGNLNLPTGTPSFWNRGGGDVTIDQVSTANSVSPTHSLAVIDNGGSFGEWYSDKALAGLANPGDTIALHWHEIYSISTGSGHAMRVTVRFGDAGMNFGPDNHFVVSGNSSGWVSTVANSSFTVRNEQLLVPAGAAFLRIQLVSGGPGATTGSYLIDDLAVSLAMTNVNSLVPYIENFPLLPNPLVIRDWKQTALDYHQLAFNPSVTGQYLPLLYGYTANTLAGYSGPAFGLPSYAGNPRDSGEALTALGAVLGGTLAGLNMASLNGIDRVQQCEVFYCVVNGHGLVFNNVNSQGSGSSWYDIYPSMLFYEIGSRYPGHASLQTKRAAIADSWLTALPVLSNNWEHTGFRFTTMTTTDYAWDEPDMAIGIAWLEYMAYVQFQNTNYLAAADTCMTQMNSRTTNPFYEVMGFYGPLLAARMNAELGRNYSTSKHLNWVFAATSEARPGWGCENARWGNFDAYGLMGSTTDSSGYAFSMNSYVAPGIITPLVRYEPQYARLLGRWLLHVAANANLFYPDTLPTNMQSSAAWVQQTGVQSISYEGVRRLGVTTPYATGDAASPIQDLNPYGAWGSGYMAALYQTSSVPGILQIDCVATEAFPPATWPTYLYYNPYANVTQVNLNVGPGAKHLYNLVTGAFLATNVSGNTTLTLSPDSSIVLVLCPATNALSQSGQKLLVGSVVVDYQNGTLDTDSDGLPDWWESRYFGSNTNTLPSAIAVNRFSNLQSYWLGLDPTNPNSTFRAQASVQSGTGYPEITWSSVGGKSYTVEYANSLSGAGGGFTPALTVTETNVPAGVESTETFVDDYSLTGGPPGANSRLYRVKLVNP